MNQHLEIEFKSYITEETYKSLLKEFDLESKTFEQTNYYFDTKDYSLMNKKTVLRIRKKDQYKLTKKEKSENGNLESSIYLDDTKALNMIIDGFDASIINEKCYVNLITSLKTIRAKCPYKSGTIFFDKSIYNGKTDYEVEYEASDIIIGQKEFEEFLSDHNIEKNVPLSKSKRAFNEIKR